MLKKIPIYVVIILTALSCKTPTRGIEQILYEGGDQIGNGDQDFNIYGNHRLKKGTYILKGWIYITNGASLTIEPGTIIKGDKDTKAALIVEPGGKLYAEGTKEEPIVFTSNELPGYRKPGDWGGVIICGNATNNLQLMMIEGGPRTVHGGKDDNDNSGVVKYVRIEFAGYPFHNDQEINGLTMGSVGRGTTVEYVQVSYCNDDSFEWFGGTVNCRYLLSIGSWDDDFDTDNGYTGTLQFLAAIRHPRIGDISLSSAFESDNNFTALQHTLPLTSPIVSNATIIGPSLQDANFVNSTSYINGADLHPHNGAKLGLFQAGLHVRSHSQYNLFNSAILGFPVGYVIEDNKGGKCQHFFDSGESIIKNCMTGEFKILGSDVSNTFIDINSLTSNYYKQASLNNQIITEEEAQIQQLSMLLNNTSLAPKLGSVLLNHSDLFTDDKIKDNTFLKKVDYIGAFASDKEEDNWMLGWTNFDPQRTIYE